MKTRFPQVVCPKIPACAGALGSKLEEAMKSIDRQKYPHVPAALIQAAKLAYFPATPDPNHRLYAIVSFVSS